MDSNATTPSPTATEPGSTRLDNNRSISFRHVVSGRVAAVAEAMSKELRKYLWGKHFWSPSYFAASCGGAPLSIIKQYIEQQNRPD